MKKLFAIIALLIVGAVGYYFTLGSQQVADEMKHEVNNQLQILQQNGFEIEDRKSEAKEDHFVVHYANPDKISRYLQTYNMNLSPEDAQKLKGLKIGVDLAYLQNAADALSVELYPVAFPPTLIQNATPEEQKIFQKIITEKIILAHIDFDKLLTSFDGYFKDIQTTFEVADPTTLVSKGFTFGGTYSNNALSSSSNALKEFMITTKSGGKLTLTNLEGGYEKNGATLYEFKSKQNIDALSISDMGGSSVALKGIRFESAGEAKNNLSDSIVKFELASADIVEPQGGYYLEGFKSKATLSNISIAAIEKMDKLDENDTEGFKEAFKTLISNDITLRLDEISLQKIKEAGSGTLMNGFDINALIKIDKNLDITQIEQNPLALLGGIDATIHAAFSDEFFSVLQKKPELTMAMLLFAPISKEGKKIFDIEYKQGKLKVNGKSAL